jgi:nitrilase
MTATARNQASEAPLHTRYKVAAVQAAPVFYDRAATVDKTIDLIREAADAGARLIAFPECWIPGYPWYVWLDSPAWGMQFVQRYHANALEVDSADTLRIREAAAEAGIWVALGFTEKMGGSLYISQMLIDDEGDIVTARRKLKPTHVERTVFGDGHGADLAVHQTPLGRIGMLCCWEHLQPLSKYALYAMNEQVHVAAWPSFSLYEKQAHMLGPEVNTAASLVYAVEGQCYVIAPCATISEALVDAICDTPDKRDLIRAGGGHARIYGPDGRLLSEILPEDQEGLVYAEIDLDMIPLAKAAADPAGHYARPDATRLLLSRSAGNPVEYMDMETVRRYSEVEMPDHECEAEHDADTR